MTCPSCFLDIRKNDTKHTCSGCGKEMHAYCSVNIDGHWCDACFSNSRDDVKLHTLTEGEETIPDEIRRSNIELYRSCGYAFYLTVIKGMRQEETIYTRLGVDLHDLFEHHAVNRNYTKEQMIRDMRPIILDYPREWFDVMSEEKVHERMENSVNGYYKFAEKLPLLPFALEETITFTVDEELPRVQITMDRVDEVSGELELSDWKTGKVMTGKKFTTDLQAPLYIYAVREKYKKPVRSFTYYYVNENKVRVFERETDDVYVCRVLNKEYRISIDEKIKEVQSIFARIKNREFSVNLDPRSMFYTCKMCTHKASGACHGAEDEQWFIQGERGWG